MRTCSTKARISSTELFDAASSSTILKAEFSLKDKQFSHSLHASISSVLLVQLMVLAKILAQVVLPTPLGPQNKKACASWFVLIAFCRVVVMCDCPTTLLKLAGRYLRAETI